MNEDNLLLSLFYLPLYKNLQECFEKKDVELLKTVLCSMDPQQAEYHMKRCVDSGLWVDNAREQQEEDGESSSNVNTDGNDDVGATIQANEELNHDNALYKFSCILSAIEKIFSLFIKKRNGFIHTSYQLLLNLCHNPSLVRLSSITLC